MGCTGLGEVFHTTQMRQHHQFLNPILSKNKTQLQSEKSHSVNEPLFHFKNTSPSNRMRSVVACFELVAAIVIRTFMELSLQQNL